MGLINKEEIITKVDAIDFVKLEKELIELANELKNLKSILNHESFARVVPKIMK